MMVAMSETYAPTAAAPAEPKTNRTRLGVTSFIIGAAGVLLTSIFTLTIPLLVRSDVSSYALVSVVGLGSTALALVLGLVALILGVIVLLKKDGTPRGFAAAGAALGGAQVFSALIGFAQSVMYNFI